MSDGLGLETNPTLLLKLRHAPRDEDAWRRFVNRYGELIFGWCGRWGLQSADAQDVTQTIMLKLVRALQTFDYDPAQSFRGWLKTLTHHAWHDLVTANRAAAADAALATVPAHDDLVARIEAGFDRELMEHAMTRVRLRVQPQTWNAFRLTAIDGVPAAEAAATLGLRIMNVYKARSNVQKQIQDEIHAMTGGDHD
jgi:RNA polymerase sigma factor (sigma-70 family)